MCGIKSNSCECCGRSEWNERPIPLELHHINGKPDDNRLENLQILCRNCHGQTDNFCGKNTKNKRKLRNQTKAKEFFLTVSRTYLEELLCVKTLAECAKELDINVHRLKYWLKKIGIKVNREWKNIKKEEYKDKICRCQNCGIDFIKKYDKQKYCCEECAHAAAMRVSVTKDGLIMAFKKNGSFLRTGKFFGVSDKAIVKWCKRFNLPTKKKELVRYINGGVM